MTALNPEAKQVETQEQAKPEVNASKQNVDTKVAQANTENPEQSGKQEPKTPETPEDPDWRAFREARKRDRAERQAAEQRAAEKEAEVAALKAAMEAAFAKGAPSPQSYQQYYGLGQDAGQQAEETEEQRIERKVNELLEKKQAQYQQQQAEAEQREFPSRLRKDFPDFANVCSQEALDYLDYHFPEVSRPLQRLPDGYDKWHDIYHAVKKFIPNSTTAKKEVIRAEINSNKPRSISSTGPSPTGEKAPQTWQEVESRRAENWARMQRVMKGV